MLQEHERRPAQAFVTAQAGPHLICAKEAAERAHAAQARCLANMSHELRTPLNAIMGYAQLLSVDATLTGRQRLAVDTIYSSGKHLLALITDLLDLAHSKSGQLELRPNEFELAHSLEETANIVSGKAAEAGLKFSCEVGAEVPRVILADERRLRQVLLNLLGNAVKFTRRGEVVLSVRLVDLDDERARIRFAVSDTGVGMRADELDKIFHPFVQVGDPSHRVGGTGLGLAISQQLLGLMSSELKVSSTPGAGSTFTFDLDVPLALELA